MVFKQKRLQRIIKQHPHDPEAVREAVLEETKANPAELIPFFDRLDPYLETSDFRKILQDLFDTDADNLARYAGAARSFFPDDELRRNLTAYHNNHAWNFYINANNFETLFPSNYFNSVFQGAPELSDTNLFKIFLLYNASAPIEAFSDGVRNTVLGKVSDDSQLEVRVGNARDPGFACGGMDQNYLDAARDNQGLVRVNGDFLAKLYHRKGDDKAKKVSYIVRENAHSSNGKIVWKNMVYSPAEHQHEHIFDALNTGEKEIEIPNMIVKPVRPLIGTTSEEIFNLYESNK